MGIQFRDALSLHRLWPRDSPIYPAAPKARAGVDRWLDWTLSTLQPVDRPVFWALVRTPVEKRDMVAIQKDVDAEAVVWRIVEAQLATRRFIEGDQFTIADIALGAYARRWLGVEGVTKPNLPNLERWFAQFAARPGFVAVHRAADDLITFRARSLSASRRRCRRRCSSRRRSSCRYWCLRS